MNDTDIHERGPWRVLHHPGFVAVVSDDFEHDAMLTVSGDFGSHALKLEYAEELARRLNQWQTEHGEPLPGAL